MKMKMKIIYCVLMVICTIMIAYWCTLDKEYDKQEQNEKYISNRIITGEVKEIIGTNEVRIEITKERGGYRKGDIIVLIYEEVSVEMINEEEVYDISQNFEIREGDSVSAKIGGNSDEKGEYDSYYIEEIVKIIY